MTPNEIQKRIEAVANEVGNPDKIKEAAPKIMVYAILREHSRFVFAQFMTLTFFLCLGLGLSFFFLDGILRIILNIVWVVAVVDVVGKYYLPKDIAFNNAAETILSTVYRSKDDKDSGSPQSSGN
jgi:hypothetical protein